MTQRLVALTADLLFSSNIEATLTRAGFDVAVVDDLSSLEADLASHAAALVILDLHAGAPAGEVVRLAGAAPVLAFGRHTEPALLRAARESGCAEVVVRSTFVEEMTGLVRRLASA